MKEGFRFGGGYECPTCKKIYSDPAGGPDHENGHKENMLVWNSYADMYADAAEKSGTTTLDIVQALRDFFEPKPIHVTSDIDYKWYVRKQEAEKKLRSLCGRTGE